MVEKVFKGDGNPYGYDDRATVGSRMGLSGRELAAWKAANPDVSSWQPQCACNAPTRPQVVLDPFMGSGTTAAVAHALGRDWLGFDLDERAIGWTRGRLAKMPVGTLFDLASG